MFGYVKVDSGELKGKYNELYKAFYCGLCRSMKKNVSWLYTSTLNYDFVFFAFLRTAASGEKPEFGVKRCSAHPLKKRRYVKDCESLKYTVNISLLFTYRKLCDDLKDLDTGFWKRQILRPVRFMLGRKLKRAEKDQAFRQAEDYINPHFERLTLLEGKKSNDLDAVCECSGKALGEAAGFGLDKANGQIAYHIGDMVGRFIYTIDACDDIENDEKSGSYNPLLLIYGSGEEAKKHFEEIDLAASQYLVQASRSAELLQCDSALCEIMKNVFEFGLGKEAMRIFNKKAGSK